MKRKHHKYIAAGAIALAFFLLVVGTTFAQESTGISISPPTFELTANPGDILENTIKVGNISDSPIKVSTDKRNFTALGEEGAVGLTEEETSFSLASWITIEPRGAIIDPGTTKIFTFRTVVPLNAEPGGHFGSVIFITGGGVPTETGAAVAQEIASLVLLRIAGEITESATLESFETDKPFYEYGPTEFDIRINNTGNVHLKPWGVITITNQFGKQVTTIEVEPKNVLPGAIRRNSAIWDRKVLLGKYTATAFLKYGIGNQSLVATTTFSGFPYRAGAAVALVALVSLVVLYKMRRRIKLAFQVLFGKYNSS